MSEIDSNKPDAADFIVELKSLINRFNEESRSNTPDFILAQYIDRCLRSLHVAIWQRDEWYSRNTEPNELKPK